MEHIFIAGTDAGPEEVARLLASLAGMSVSKNEKGRVFLSRPARDRQIGGELSVNDYVDAAPEEGDESLIDDFPLVLDVGYTGRERNVQLAEARALFADLAEGGELTLALVQNMDLLLAVSTPEHGTVWMPPDTTPDAEHRERWGRYRVRG
ncbi:hypothetical protein JCM9533A_87020 [Catenuloplanes niger JCM 9533]